MRSPDEIVKEVIGNLSFQIVQQLIIIEQLKAEIEKLTAEKIQNGNSNGSE